MPETPTDCGCAGCAPAGAASRPDGSGASLLRLTGLRAGYRGVAALEGVDLELFRGEVLAVVGPNGAGKTTLLRVLAGLHPLSGGRLQWADGASRRTGYVPQAGRPDSACPVTVEEFLELAFEGPAGGRPGRGLLRERVAASAGQTGCGHLLGRRFAALSGGETQRVFLAYALLRDAELLLLDEPQTGLDAASSQALADTLTGLAGGGGGRCLVLVSHDLHFVARVATRVLCLRGHVCSVGPVSEMLALHVAGAAIH